jgi:hypothetical protein
MRAMRHRERVVHEDVAERGELIDEGGVVAFFPGVEARVLQAQDIARLHRIDRRHGRCAHAIIGERHRPFEHLRNRRRQRLERLGRIASLRTSEMGKQDHFAALVGDLADGLSDALDAGGVRDLAVLDRDVEIDAHKHAFAPEVGLIERAEHDYRPGRAVSTHTIATVNQSSRVGVRSACPSQPRYRPCGWRSPTHCRTTTSPAPACRPTPWSGRWRRWTSARRG